MSALADLIDILDSIADEDLDLLRERFAAARSRAKRERHDQRARTEVDQDPAFGMYLTYLHFTHARTLERLMSAN